MSNTIFIILGLCMIVGLIFHLSNVLAEYKRDREIDQVIKELRAENELSKLYREYLNEKK